MTGRQWVAIVALAALAVACAPTTSRLEVVRRVTFVPYAAEFEPFDRVVIDPASIAGIADAVRTLPPVPAGVRFCPIGWGLRYRLIFDGPPHERLAVDVEADGCREAVIGLFDRRATTESFWGRLAGALGYYTRGNDLFPMPKSMQR